MLKNLTFTKINSHNSMSCSGRKTSFNFWLRWLTLGWLLLVLSACSTQVKTTSDTSVDAQRKIHPNPEVEAQIQRLEAASILTQQNKHQESLVLMQGLQAQLLPEEYHWQALTVATNNSLKLEDGWQALHFLNLFSQKLQKVHKSQAYELSGWRADAYLLIGYLPQALQARHNQARFAANAKDLEHTYTALWHNLKLISSEQLKELIATEQQASLRGWLELALTSHAVIEHPEVFQRRLISWQQRWRQHPAQKYMPEEITLLNKLSQQQIKHLGVFLPETGSLAKHAQALKDALIASQLHSLQQGYPTPKLSFYSTSGSETLWQLYKQAKAEGVEIIIGPFAKQDVVALEQLQSLPLPTLALNYGNSEKLHNKDLFQFGLSSENEAAQVAQKAWQTGYRRALTLSPNNSWGHRVSASFIQEWKRLGGEVTYSSEYGAGLSLDKSLRNLLEVELSQQRHQRLTRLLGQRPHFSPRPREDSDFLFLHADPNIARQIKPALRFLSAGNLPVLATASVYNGINRPTQDQDLNGLVFVDIPWYLDDLALGARTSANPQDSLAYQIRTTWASSMPTYGRFYAMGADAFMLAQRLPLLAALPSSRLEGATGRLSQKNQRIQRDLDWAYFEQGRVQPINDKVLLKPSAQQLLDAN